MLRVSSSVKGKSLPRPPRQRRRRIRILPLSNTNGLLNLSIIIIIHRLYSSEKFPMYISKLDFSKTPSTIIADCQNLLKRLSVLKKNIIMQWILSHCGILGNEKADGLAKKELEFCNHQWQKCHITLQPP